MRAQWLLGPQPSSHTPPEHIPEIVVSTAQPAFSEHTCLDISRPPVEVQMEIFYFTKLGEFVSHVILCRLFMDVRDQNDPSFDSYIES